MTNPRSGSVSTNGRKLDFGSLPIPKGLRRKAQGCEVRATLGKNANHKNPNGVATRGAHSPKPKPRWGFAFLIRCPRVARPSQPWALLRNPVGIQGKNTLPNLHLRPRR